MLSDELQERISTAEQAVKDCCAAAIKTLDKVHIVDAPLYHYTTAESLQGILRHQQFWCTSVRHLNDPSELEHGMSLLHSTLTQLKLDPDGDISAIATDIQNELSDEWHELFGLYPLCFSRKRDDLSQWIAYGDDGKGFCIALAPTLFKVEENAVPPKFNFVIRLEYDDSIVRGWMMRDAKNAAKILKKATEDFDVTALPNEVGEEFMGELTRSISTRLAGNLFFYAANAKHNSYSNEEETRLLIFNNNEALSDHIETRTRKSQIVPYIRNEMPVRTPGNTIEIMIGPSADPSAEDALKTLLSSLAMPTDIVHRSNIPYRS